MGESLRQRTFTGRASGEHPLQAGHPRGNLWAGFSRRKPEDHEVTLRYTGQSVRRHPPEAERPFFACLFFESHSLSISR